MFNNGGFVIYLIFYFFMDGLFLMYRKTFLTKY